MTLWESCGGEARTGLVQGRLFRLVESQERVATLGYVDSLEEQALLEELLEHSKPDYPEYCRADLHYLLATPFRYPPLPWGSRFGGRHQPGIFYGGCSQRTTLAEAAFYRFVFWHSIQADPPAAILHSEHTLFTVPYRTERGVRLQQSPFDAHRQVLRNPAEYAPTQALGRAMRDAGVEAFEYASARDPEGGSCVGLFTPAPFTRRAPTTLQAWFCELGAEEVAFKPQAGAEVLRFPLELFLVDGQLPRPAS
ncbi:MAG: RES family NAD+ phosphorylase [Haliea sp.]|uniref:RES family NAD+ phosphorylase n=1 Tax=Haliea sp. TaxID=1932666 RepID=UPI0032EAFBC2